MPSAERLREPLDEYGDRVLRFCLVCLAEEAKADRAAQEIFRMLAEQTGKTPMTESRVLGTALRVLAGKSLPQADPGPGVLGGIGSLPKGQKLAVLARCYLGLSEQEAARWLRVPRWAFSARLRKAEAALNIHLNGK